jgi:two-component system, NarL family, sensor histidine kinase BarA
MKILLINNDPSIRSILEECISACNHELLNPSHIVDGEPTLEGNYEVVVFEFGHQTNEWLSLIERQRNHCPSPSFIFIGNNCEDEISTAHDLRGNAYLTKPIHPKLLSMTLAQVSRRIELEKKVDEAKKEAERVQKELEESLERQKDATAEKELTYRELLLAYSRLQDLNQKKNKFLALATHELRTPVTVMKGYHRILLDERLGKLQAQQKKVLRESEESCTRLNKIINSLLDLSRIETGKLELIYQENDFADNIKAVISQMKETCKRKRLSFILKVDRDLPRFKFDRDKINQVLANLLENSIKYTPSRGKIYISVQAHFWERRNPTDSLEQQNPETRSQRERGAVNHQSNAVMVEISDTGIGISPENQQEIFEEFTQISSNQMNRSGLGLGLAISKRIIDAHGGKIWVDSQLNSGSKFMFLLPLNPIEALL